MRFKIHRFLKYSGTNNHLLHVKHELVFMSDNIISLYFMIFFQCQIYSFIFVISNLSGAIVTEVNLSHSLL